MKAYIQYNGKTYYGYDCIGLPFMEPYIFCSATKCLLKDNIKSLMTPGFLPTAGNNVCVIPECKINVEDIRNNYSIKRGIDKGSCNIFSPIKSFSTYLRVVLIIPPKSTIFVTEYNYRDSVSEIRKKLNILREQTFPGETFDSKDLIYTKLYLGPSNCSDAYPLLLEGKLKTPSVFIDDLPLYSAYPLTVDPLYLMFKTGIQGASDEDIKNFVTAVHSLNTKNWRPFEGTMSLLVKEILMRIHRGTFWTVWNRISQYDKTVKNILSVKIKPFVSKEDYELGKQLLLTILGAKSDTIFTDVKGLETKLNDVELTQDALDKVFTNVVRLKAKGYEEKDSVSTE